MKKRVQVAVGIIRNAQREVFLTQRGADSHLAGFWEFPGGKIEAGECAEDALRRELDEEIGIEVQEARLLDSLSFEFADRHVHLYFFLIERYRGQPYGREGQHSAWVPQHTLTPEMFPEANAPVIRTLLEQARVEAQAQAPLRAE
ncbi:MAG: 8-oxo-dGTP diphosphatase MutT [Plesiomonas shigelloides]